MSAVRVGEWHLLGYDSDPVPADSAGLDPVIAHYRKIAEAMSTQAALLKKVAEGNEDVLKGEYADKIRKGAEDCHEVLGKVATRYGDIKSALETYQPELGTARQETQTALDDAEAAAKLKSATEGTADPVESAEGKGDEPTDKDRTASAERTATIEKQQGIIDGAKAAAERALEALATAAQTASDTIRKHWDTDGLHHSWSEKVAWQFAKIGKIIVEILGYIGMALAVLAIIFPGIGWIAIAGLVTAAVSLVFSIALASIGESSWMNVILGVITVVSFGVGYLAMRGLKIATGAGLKVGDDIALGAVGQAGRIENQIAFWSKFTTGPFSDFAKKMVVDLAGRQLNLIAGIGKWNSFMNVAKPGSWSIFKDPGLVWKMLGLGEVNIAKNLAAVFGSNSIFAGQGLGLAVKPWMYLPGPVNFAFGLGAGAFGFAAPSDIAEIAGLDDARTDDPYKEYEDEHLKSDPKFPLDHGVGD